MYSIHSDIYLKSNGEVKNKKRKRKKVHKLHLNQNKAVVVVLRTLSIFALHARHFAAKNQSI